MSGNPFRASLSHNPAASAPAAPISFADVDDRTVEGVSQEFDAGTVTPPRPAKTKKSVRIESPASSPPQPVFQNVDESLLRNPNIGRHVNSPPLRSPTAFPYTLDDRPSAEPFSGGRAEDDVYSTRRSLGITRKDSDMLRELQQSPTGVPANPFSRTLATIEPIDTGAQQAYALGQTRDRLATEKPGLGSKGNLDVESFKNLLMKGISSPSSSGQSLQTATAPHPLAPSVFESSSSTDTSSISRQSIFEPVQDTHVDTPRTSYEMAESDDDTVGLVSDVRKPEKRKPPPAPKHRHGKLVTARTPQTVAFSEFSATPPAASPVSRDRASSDLNKPLPPTPPVIAPPLHIVSHDISTDKSLPSESKPIETPSLPDIPTPQKKTPPPVPLVRRQSQLRTSAASTRSRSNSNLTMTSQHSIDVPLLSPSFSHEPTSSPSTNKSPPPPPPARRHGASLTGSNTPSANTSTTDLTSSIGVRRSNTVSSPNPPSRRTTFSSPPPSPVPGTSSRNNPRSVSNESATMAPPPPPPPRRRQSGRSSLDKERPLPPSSSPTESRRTSLENKRSSFDGRRRTSLASESSLRHEYAPSSENEHVLYSPKEEVEEPLSLEPVMMTKSDSSNILDDMDKFQREIDELRQRYKPE
ncbi:hypothetical protein K491DRAFT_690416 [Lophiostoma macrostomum CBS 122681]|uniref:Uncharacterized protein n=1 Tax=Lophiostoma macrostomum CBS 122681 TaxID=1314788 RepID=A0A6A6TF37_9PLEO|nr:hypothetical protein K491DRAFT_690416 [Lophiostoma macrostomum CBS 122681]